MKLLGKDRRYRILETLGKGGSGAVYRAFDSVEKREVAIKVLSAELSASQSSLASEEFRLLASHTHANLVQVYDYGTTTDGLRYFTMELLEGEDLLGYLGRALPAPAERAAAPLLADLLDQTLAALDYIHSRGLVHQDLKPQNILVSEQEGAARVKLIDFGLARAAGTESQELSGTIEYLAPELLKGEPPTARSDLYSLGILLHEIFLGQPPFHGKKMEELIKGHLEGVGVDPRSLPQEYRELTMRLLEKDPANRPRAAEEVRRELPGARERTPHSLPAFSPVFVGREATLSKLLARIAAEPDGGPGGALLLGPTGMGKSRLLRELQVRTQVSDIPIYLEACREEDHPGALLQRLLGRIAAENDGEHKLVARLDECLDGLLQDDSVAGASIESFHFKVTNLLVELAGGEACAIAIDDLQWADSLSLNTLAHLARRAAGAGTPPGLFLACRLDGEEDLGFTRNLEELFNIPESLERITLEGLEPGDLSTLSLIHI